MAQAYINGLKIAGLVAVATVIASSLAAYAIAKIESPGKRLSFATLMATIMIPSQATLFPVYILMRRIGWIDTYWPLIAPPALTNALGVFRLRQLCTGVPNDLIDAARIEGDFRDVANLNRDLKSLGYKAQTYLFPYVYVATELYNPGAAGDFFLKNRHGGDYLIPFHTVDAARNQPTTRRAAIIDFSNPAAVDWNQEIIHQVIVDLDFDGWMRDFGEDLPAAAVFHNGKTGAEMHNIYPALCQKATFDACRRHKAAVSYCARAAYAGSQGYAMAIWNGDCCRTMRIRLFSRKTTGFAAPITT